LSLKDIFLPHQNGSRISSLLHQVQSNIRV
jgi:hypothetical protein